MGVLVGKEGRDMIEYIVKYTVHSSRVYFPDYERFRDEASMKMWMAEMHDTFPTFHVINVTEEQSCLNIAPQPKAAPGHRYRGDGSTDAQIVGNAY